MSKVDEFLAELDMLALADAVGVLRSGPVEPVMVERGRAVRRARSRRVEADRVRRWARAFEDIAVDRSQGDRGQGDRGEVQRRDLANMLAGLGFSVEYLAHRFGLTPREGL